MKPVIKIIDGQFVHSKGGSFGTGDLNTLPNHFSWNHDPNYVSDLVVVTEDSFSKRDLWINHKHKVALILEPRCINRAAYQQIEYGDWRLFEYVLTHDMELMKKIPNARSYMFGGCWIEEKRQEVYAKTKNVSIIASAKKQTIGHMMRHEAIEKYGSMIDGVFGRGYTEIANKLEGLKDYRFSIAIENEKRDTWITEKVIDCFRTGTIPIYYGTDQIREYYDEEGIMFFNNIEELEDCLKRATPEYYNSQLRAVEKNFNLSKLARIPEDALWSLFFHPTYFAHAKANAE